MTQNIFGLLFIIGATALLIAADYFYGLENLKSFLLMPILAAYFLGRYSTKFPTEKE